MSNSNAACSWISIISVPPHGLIAEGGIASDVDAASARCRDSDGVRAGRRRRIEVPEARPANPRCSAIEGDADGDRTSWVRRSGTDELRHTALGAIILQSRIHRYGGKEARDARRGREIRPQDSHSAAPIGGAAVRVAHQLLLLVYLWGDYAVQHIAVCHPQLADRNILLIARQDSTSEDDLHCKRVRLLACVTWR